MRSGCAAAFSRSAATAARSAAVMPPALARTKAGPKPVASRACIRPGPGANGSAMNRKSTGSAGGLSCSSAWPTFVEPGTRSSTVRVASPGPRRGTTICSESLLDAITSAGTPPTRTSLRGAIVSKPRPDTLTTSPGAASFGLRPDSTGRCPRMNGAWFDSTPPTLTTTGASVPGPPGSSGTRARICVAWTSRICAGTDPNCTVAPMPQPAPASITSSPGMAAPGEIPCRRGPWNTATSTTPEVRPFERTTTETRPSAPAATTDSGNLHLEPVGRRLEHARLAVAEHDRHRLRLGAKPRAGESRPLAHSQPRGLHGVEAQRGTEELQRAKGEDTQEQRASRTEGHRPNPPGLAARGARCRSRAGRRPPGGRGLGRRSRSRGPARSGGLRTRRGRGPRGLRLRRTRDLRLRLCSGRHRLGLRLGRDGGGWRARRRRSGRLRWSGWWRRRRNRRWWQRGRRLEWRQVQERNGHCRRRRLHGGGLEHGFGLDERGLLGGGRFRLACHEELVGCGSRSGLGLLGDRGFRDGPVFGLGYGFFRRGRGWGARLALGFFPDEERIFVGDRGKASLGDGRGFGRRLGLGLHRDGLDCRGVFPGVGLRLGRGLGGDHVRGDGLRRCGVAFDDHGVLGGVGCVALSGDAGQHLDPRLEVQLHADAVRLLGRTQPQHVALADGGLVLHARGVDVDAPRRTRVVDDRLVEVGPQLGVDRADPGKLHHQVAVGIGADQDLGHDLVGVVTAPVKGTTEDGERNEPQVAL